MTQTHSPAVLISAERLAKLIQLSGPLLVLDCRHSLADVEAGFRAWLAGHVPGAVHVHLDQQLSGVMTGRNGRHPLPDAAEFVASMQQLGWQPNTPVVAYDDAGGLFAARAWWMLRAVGGANVCVLDGGIQAWQAAGGALEYTQSIGKAVPPEQAATQFANMPLVTVDEVIRNLAQPKFLVVDARSADRFAGENETLDPVGGHIPGAQNRFCRDNLAASGCFKPVEKLRAEWMGVLNVQGRQWQPNEVVHQCGSGVTACHNILAMEHAGLTGSSLYAGSWSEWCSDPSRPVAVGSA